MKNILVVGGGLIGLRHIQTVQAHTGCHFVGLVDSDPFVQIDGPQFKSLTEVQAPVDGVIVATPTPLHSDHGIEAAKRGWHVLIEKPVAGSAADAQRLQDCLAQTKTASLVGHHRRYHAHVQQLKQVIADGAIGAVVNVSLIWAMRKPDAYFDVTWRSADASPVMINIVHDIDILRFCIGEIMQTAALRGGPLRGLGAIESGAVALAFENGATGTIAFADTSPSPWGFEAGTGENPHIGTTGQDMMWIMGTKGAISYPSMTLWQGADWGTAATQTPLAKAQNTRTPLEAQLDHFVDVMEGAAPLIDVADATRTLTIAEDIEAQLAAQVLPRRDAHA